MNDFIVEGLSKSAADKQLFKDISFLIHEGDRIGLIGVNGTGKSSLLDILAGIEGYDGEKNPFTKSNDYKVGYLRQEPDFDESKTVLETVLESQSQEMQVIQEYERLMLHYNENEGRQLETIMAKMDALNAWAIESQVKTVLSKLGVTDLESPVSTLSGGMRRRVQLAQVLLADDDLLLLDEPTNHLDIESIEWLIQFLKNSKRTLLFITHDRYFLDHLSTRVFELSRGRLQEYQGNYQSYVQQKAEEDERMQASQHKKEQLYKQELAWMRRQPQARATKQEARIKRFENLKKEVRQTSKEGKLEVGLSASRIGKQVLEFDQVSFAYGDRPIIQDFSYLIQNRDRIGIVGPNGIGKSTLLHLIDGKLQPDSGVIKRGETVSIAYFSQHIEGLDESKRLIQYLEELAKNVKVDGRDFSITDLLERFLFPKETHGSFISKLSGGEKKRLFLLKLLIEKPNVLLLDEPTNDLDIATLTVLEDFLQDFAGPVITVSHDRYFLDKVANKILSFETEGIREYFGNYSDFLDEKAFLEEAKAKESKEKAQPKEKAKREGNKKVRLSYLEQKEWDQIEDQISQIEEEIEAIEAEMLANPSDFTLLGDLQKKLDQANQDLLEKYERYEYLSDIQSQS